MKEFVTLNGHNYAGELLFAGVFVLAALVIVWRWVASKIRIIKKHFKK